jgi:hypothetical protein
LQESGLPEEVRRLIVDHIESVEQLEILLLLYQQRGRTWTAEEVARELRVAASSAGERLEELQRDALLSRVEGEPMRYRYDPASSKLDGVVGGLATAYSERRVTVINLIFSKPVDKIRTFADAFRLRRDDDNS